MATVIPYSRRLRRTVARLWRSIRERFLPAVERADQGAESRRRVRARARFWAEFRRGQREARVKSQGRYQAVEAKRWERS